MMMTISPLYHSEGESEVAARVVRVDSSLHGPRDARMAQRVWRHVGKASIVGGGGERFLDGRDRLAIVLDHMARAIRVPASHVREKPRRDTDRWAPLRGFAFTIR